ncbi:MAG: rod shape-determining protein MreD [Candidatus Omnitrophica bacterium]|nr:rod shape-determining protein MreD [Candidatus Omnitrophota bacterium]
MKPTRLFLLGLLVGWIQGSLEKTWSFGGPAPDLLLLFLIWLGLNGHTGVGLWVAFLGGILQDSVAGIDLVGLHSIGRVFVAYLPEWGRLALVPDHRFAGFLLVLGATLLQAMIVISIRQTLTPGDIWGLGVLYNWGFSIILNGGVWLLLAFTLLPDKKSEYVT